ncbi:MAG: hypothetical protein Q8934_14425 [Bacillota bacterium]|nr:hypothetical protein [Bacillota bacterium]
MGGMGSGPYGFRGTKQRKLTVEEVPHIEVQQLKGNLHNEDLTCSWDNGEQSIRILTKINCIILKYRAGEEKIKEYVAIKSSKVGFGERLWFCCPECDKKTARLYIVGKFFRCRECHQLTYSTCQESGDPLDYLSLKIRRLQKKLGLPFGNGILNCPNINELPFFKLKNMHWETFARERERLELMQLARLRAWLEVCRRF